MDNSSTKLFHSLCTLCKVSMVLTLAYSDLWERGGGGLCMALANFEALNFKCIN